MNQHEEQHHLCDAAAAECSIEHRSKPFAGFGSYRQRHGDALLIGKSVEAPAKLSSTTAAAAAAPADALAASAAAASTAAAPKSASSPLNIPKSSGSGSGGGTTSNKEMRRRALRSGRSKSELEREEAWERKKDQRIQEELMETTMKASDDRRPCRAVGRSASDCAAAAARTGGGGAATSARLVARPRSLTDDDLDELRGSIDLGFGFSNSADPKLWNTLPALELCYAINQHYHSRSSPVESDSTTASECSPSSSPSWTISSPGDNPQLVKTRLRHWAQAVACTVRQGVKQDCP